jgi:tetraacyldisaccharide 4'-kinase
MAHLVERIWYDGGAAPAATRAMLWPLARLYELSVRARETMYDRHVLSSVSSVLPTVGVGNLTVGGTGKTPFSAWIAQRLEARGANPAIVLRGYGADEVKVHETLNPEVPVVTDPDRAEGVRLAKLRGADVVVLDDAFQHRRLVPTQGILLLSAEQLDRPRRLLPAGPWREPLSAARRADLIVVTRKSASDASVRDALSALQREVPRVPTATVHLAPHMLMSGAATQPLDRLRGAEVLAIAAIGEPDVFARQLEQLGARVRLARFRDHHAFTDDEVRALALAVPAGGLAVCTLKDAVKLGAKWPPSSRLWYVSQRLVVERGADEIDRVLTRALEARAAGTATAD